MKKMPVLVAIKWIFKHCPRCHAHKASLIYKLLDERMVVAAGSKESSS